MSAVVDDMSRKKEQKDKNDIEDLLKNLLIVELAKTGVPQSEIRRIVGGDIVRVNRIARFFKKKPGGGYQSSGVG